jgi:hypothetical protein
MKTPKKNIQKKPIGKPTSKKDEKDLDTEDIRGKANLDEDDDDYDLPLDDFENFENFDDDDDDF